MIKLLLEYLSMALSGGIGPGLLCAIFIAWIPFTIWTPVAISIVTVIRAIQAIQLTQSYINKDNIPETVFSIFRIVVIVTATYFVGTQIYNLIGGYWGRFIAVLCAVPASMILHGIVLWFSDISQGPPYFNHHSPSEWPPLSVSETTEEYSPDSTPVQHISERGQPISLILMTKSDQESWIDDLTYNAHSPRHDHSITFIKADQVSKSASNLNETRILVSDTATVSDVIAESKKHLRGLTKPDVPLVLYYPALNNERLDSSCPKTGIQASASVSDR